MKLDTDSIIDVDFEQYKGKIKTGVTLVIIVALLILLVSNVVYKIDDGQAGVILNESLVYTMEYGYETISGGSTTTAPVYQDNMPEATVIVDAGQDNGSIALINLMIEYKVEDPVKYLFKVDDVEGTLRLALEESVRNAVQKLSLDEVKTEKELIDKEVILTLQAKIDSFEAGLRIVAVNTQNVEFLPSVEAAFQQKEDATQYKNTKAEEAEKYLNIIKPQAEGEATKLNEEALSYKLEVLAKANSEMAQYNALYKEYLVNPSVTKEKYYIESMQAFLANNKIVIDATNSGDGIYKFYNMDGDTTNQVKSNIAN
ncbi:MAG: hflK [Clostridiales bacterium]|nr:hflK [Clostridiales bacterium]